MKEYAAVRIVLCKHIDLGLVDADRIATIIDSGLDHGKGCLRFFPKGSRAEEPDEDKGGKSQNKLSFGNGGFHGCCWVDEEKTKETNAF